MKNINKYKQLEEEQKLIRLKMMDLIIDEKQPAHLDEIKKYISETTDLENDYVNETLEYFIENNIMVV